MENAAESFFARFRGLDEEARNALAGNAKVDAPYEYRFDIEFADRRYAVQGYPHDQRVFVGQYLGRRGVVWFDELRWDEPQHGWRTGDRAAWDFFAGLRDRPSLSHPEAEALARERAQSGSKESPTSTEEELRATGEELRASAAAAPLTTPEAGGWFATARQALRTANRVRRTARQVRTPWGAARLAVRIWRGRQKNA